MSHFDQQQPPMAYPASSGVEVPQSYPPTTQHFNEGVPHVVAAPPLGYPTATNNAPGFHQHAVPLETNAKGACSCLKSCLCALCCCMDCLECLGLCCGC